MNRRHACQRADSIEASMASWLAKLARVNSTMCQSPATTTTNGAPKSPLYYGLRLASASVAIYLAIYLWLSLSSRSVGRLVGRLLVVGVVIVIVLLLLLSSPILWFGWQFSQHRALVVVVASAWMNSSKVWGQPASQIGIELSKLAHCAFISRPTLQLAG